MKNLRLFLMLMASLAFIFISSCGKDTVLPTPTPTPTPPVVTVDTETPVSPVVKEISLSVAGGVALIVDGADATKEITVTASEEATEDIAISLSTDATEGVAFEAATITLKKGTKTVTGKVIFKVAQFPAGKAEIAVKVTIATKAPNTKVTTASTEFKVRGVDGKDMVALTGVVDVTKFNTTKAGQSAKIVITLASVLEEDFTLVGGILTASTLKTATVTPNPMVIKAGQTTITIDIAVAKGLAGTLVFGAFNSTDKSVDIQLPDYTFVFEVDPPFEVSIAAKDEIDVVVDATAVEKTFTISLNRAAEEAVNIEVMIGDAMETLIIAKGETSVDKTITINPAILNGANTARLNVEIKTIPTDFLFDEDKKTIIYKIIKEGFVVQDLKIEWYVEYGEDKYFIPEVTESLNAAIVVRCTDNAAADVKLIPTISGFAAEDYTLAAPVATISSGKNYYRFNITVNKRAVGKSMTIYFE